MLALSLALGLGACGGDNDPAAEPPTTAPPEPSDSRPSSQREASFPADFRNQVDPICQKAKAQIDKLVGNEIRDRARLKQLAGVYGDTASKLEGLKPPKKNAAAYKEFTDSFRDGQDLFTRLDGEVGRGDSSAYQRVNGELDQVNSDVKDMAIEFGFEKCASD